MTTRREEWGTYMDQEGNRFTMICGPRNRTWFEDEAGEQVSPDLPNIYPAMCWMYAKTEWFDPESVMLSVACRKEVRAKVVYK